MKIILLMVCLPLIVLSVVFKFCVTVLDFVSILCLSGSLEFAKKEFGIGIKEIKAIVAATFSKEEK